MKPLARAHAQKVVDYFARYKVFHGAMAVRVTNDLRQVVLRLPFKRAAWMSAPVHA